MIQPKRLVLHIALIGLLASSFIGYARSETRALLAQGAYTASSLEMLVVPVIVIPYAVLSTVGLIMIWNRWKWLPAVLFAHFAALVLTALWWRIFSGGG